MDERMTGACAEGAAETGTDLRMEEATGPASVAVTGEGDLAFAPGFADRMAQTPDALGDALPENRVPCYSVEELAAAVRSGDIDPERMQPEVREVYFQVVEQLQRAEQAQRAAQAAQNAQMNQAAQRASAHVPAPTPDFERLRALGRKVAAERLLGIREDEFNESDPRHAQAQNMAMLELRDAAANLQRQDVARVQAVQHAHAQYQQIAGDYRQAYEAFGRENPDIDMRAFDAGFGDWLSGLTVREAHGVRAALQSGDPRQVRAVMARMAADYRRANQADQANPAGPAKGGGYGAAAVTRRRAAQAPPEVEGSGGGFWRDEGGVIDVSKLGEMSTDEQAELLLRARIV